MRKIEHLNVMEDMESSNEGSLTIAGSVDNLNE
jgi:hypothetical protein